MKIVVLAGGRSPEREVSLSSGRLVSEALRRRGHDVLLLDLWRGISDREIGDDPMRLFCKDGAVRQTETFPDPVPIGEPLPALDADRGSAPVGENVLFMCRLADMVFLALHGAAGENGQVQAMLDCFGIRYTGSGYGASFLAMDKPLSKLILRQGGVPTPDWYVPEAGWTAEKMCAEITARVGFPCVLKPCDGGSSVGVSMADHPAALTAACEMAVRYGARVMAERRIMGREFSVAVLGERTLPAVEIIPHRGFYDYAHKYIPGMTEEVCPAPLSEAQSTQLASLALQGFRLLGLRGYARGDFMLDSEGRFTCLEYNSLPGMTPTSLLPQEAAAAGISYEELCETIVCMACRGEP